MTGAMPLHQAVEEMVVAMAKEKFNAPDDDWTPTAFATLTVDGIEQGMVLELDPNFFRDDAGKDALVATLRQFVKSQTPTELTVLFNMMVRKVRPEDLAPDVRAIPPHELTSYSDLGMPPPVEDPKATEMLMLITWFPDGSSQVTTADIVRHKDKPPTLEPWATPPEATQYVGRFHQPLSEAMVVAHRTEEP